MPQVGRGPTCYFIDQSYNAIQMDQQEHGFNMKNFSSSATLPFFPLGTKMKEGEVGTCRVC
jgi:hypothetical protein